MNIWTGMKVYAALITIVWLITIILGTPKFRDINLYVNSNKTYCVDKKCWKVVEVKNE